MLKIDEVLSRQLALVTAIATVLVVMCHTDDIFPQALRSWWVNFLGGPFTDANVANFFFLSGLLVARRAEERGWWQAALGKRLKTLLLPYALWSLLYFLLGIDCGADKPLPFTEQLMTADMGLAHIFGLGLLNAPADFALWYIKTLLCFIFISPPFFWLLRRTRWGLPLLLAGALTFYYAILWFKLPFEPIFLSAGALFHLVGLMCFLTGATITFRPGAFAWARRWWMAPIALALWFGAALVKFPLHIHAFWVPHCIALEVFALQLFAAAIPIRVPCWLTGTLFFIYAAHMAVLQLFARVLPAVCEVLSPMGTYALILTLTLFLCVGASLLLKRFFPRLAAPLHGGR